MSEETTDITPKKTDTTQLQSIIDSPFDIKNLIYIIRNQHIMLDSDLAALYQVETGTLNQAVKMSMIA